MGFGFVHRALVSRVGADMHGRGGSLPCFFVHFLHFVVYALIVSKLELQGDDGGGKLKAPLSAVL